MPEKPAAPPIRPCRLTVPAPNLYDKRFRHFGATQQKLR